MLRHGPPSRRVLEVQRAFARRLRALAEFASAAKLPLIDDKTKSEYRDERQPYKTAVGIAKNRMEWAFPRLRLLRGDG